MQIGPKGITGTNHISRQQVAAQTAVQKFNRAFARGSLVLGSVFIMGAVAACGGVIVVTPPPVNNPVQVPVEQVQDGRVHSAFVIEEGKPFTVQIGAVEAPVLESTYIERITADNDRMRTIQTNWVSVSGTVERGEDGKPRGTVKVDCTLSFETVFNGTDASGGSKFFHGVPVVFLGEQFAVSTPDEAKKAGEIWIAKMPVSGWLSMNGEKRGNVQGLKNISVYAKLVGMKDGGNIFENKWMPKIDFGTIIDNERHGVSNLEALPVGVPYAVQFQPGSIEAARGIARLEYIATDAQKTRAYVDVFVDSGRVDQMDGISRARFGQNTVVSAEKDGAHVQTVTFSSTVQLDGGEVLPFGSGNLGVRLSEGADGQLSLVMSSKK